jgi:hypothetical protein
MRPTFELDPGLLAPESTRPGTERHTLPGISPPEVCSTARPLLDGLADDFFAAGDDGRFAGEDELNAEELDVDEAPVTVIVRTPEMEARRAKLARFVAVAVGSLAALFAFGVASNARSASAAASEQRAAAVLEGPATAELPRGDRFAARVGSIRERAASPAPLDAERLRAPARPSPASIVVASSPSRASASPARRASGSTSTSRASSAAVPAPTRRALPSVVNFAARAGDAPKSASRPPTAAFAPVQ